MATGGSIGNGGYQGRYIEFAWSLQSQDIQNNCSTIYWRVTVVGGSSSFYYHYRDYCDAFGEVLVNSNSRTKRYCGDLANGYKTIYHDANGNASFGAHVIAAVYTSTTNEDVSGSWSLPTIARQANITNVINNFNDEENPWFDYSNPGNWTCKAWLEPNPGGPHYAERTVTGTGGRYTWNLSDAERKQLRHACKGNSCTIRIGLYSNGTTWASYHDRQFSIKNPDPVVSTPSWVSTNLAALADTSTVIKGCSNIRVTVQKATPVKESTITQYKVVCGTKEKTGDVAGDFDLENVDASIIHVYVTDSRGNVVEKILNISKFIEYVKPVITELGFERGSGGIGTQVNMTYKGTMWVGNFGMISNDLTTQYFYKEQGSSTWVTGVTAINPTAAANFSKTTSIRGDLAALGFDAGKNYDFKIIVTDKINQVEKLGILSSGIPTTAYHPDGFCVGGFYDENEGGPFQIEGKQQPVFELIETVDVEI